MIVGEVSVVIPAFNGARYIGAALESAFTQDAPPHEILVVDDASTDNTVAVAETMISRSPCPMRVIRLPENSGGPPRPINVGVEAASGRFVSVLDQDDVYATDILRRMSAALDDATHCCAAFCWSANLDKPGGGPIQGEELRERLAAAGVAGDGHVEIPGAVLLAELVTFNNFVGGYPGFVFRRDQWVRKGGVDESLRISSDLEFLGWLFQQGAAALVPTVGYLRRLHGENATRNARLMYFESAIVIARMLQSATCLQSQPAAMEQAKEVMRGIAYWFRQAQLYRESAHLYRLLARLGDSRLATIARLTKLQFHRAHSAVLRTRPESSSYIGVHKN